MTTESPLPVTYVVELSDDQVVTVPADTVSTEGGALHFSLHGVEQIGFAPRCWRTYRLQGLQLNRVAPLTPAAPSKGSQRRTPIIPAYPR